MAGLKNSIQTFVGYLRRSGQGARGHLAINSAPLHANRNSDLIGAVWLDLQAQTDSSMQTWTIPAEGSLGTGKEERGGEGMGAQ